MKQKLTILFLVLPMMFMTLSAQTVLTYATHGMQEGDVLTLTNLTDFKVGNGGADQVWDFSNAKTNGSTQTIEYNANPSAERPFACLMDKKSTVFHSVSNKEKLYYGVRYNNANIEFEKPIKELVFPFRYQSQISGEMKGTYTILPSGKKETIDGNYSVTADGWGTIILPNRVTLHNVLRVVYVKDYTQTMGNLQYYITVKHYLYYAAESRYAVLQVREVKSSCDCACNSNELTACYNASVVPFVQNNEPKPQSLSETAPELNFTLYPNPAKTELRVNYNLSANANITISIIDLAGKKMKTIVNAKQELGTYSVTGNVADLPNGTYLLEMQINDKVYTETFIKQ